MTVKLSVDELFMHYFQNIRRLRGFDYGGPRWGR